MQYLPSPTGAIVQSHGRLGSLLFEPGDIILEIGGIAVSSVDVDDAINEGYLSSKRSVSLRDRSSGRVVRMFY